MTRRRKQPQVTVIVLAQDCLSDRGSYLSPEECEAIAEVFSSAAQAIREGKHGAVSCVVDGEILAEVGIDNGGHFDYDKGLPVIKNVQVKA